MFKKIVTIAIPIIAVIAVIFAFGLKVYQESFDTFQYDGYVIGKIDGKESAKYYFSKNNNYKVNESKNEVEFKNSSDKDVVVPEASFVHYADGSISTFKKAVVLNLENVKGDSLQYYNVYNGSVFTKTADGYQIKYLEQKLSFDDFIIKISDTKYMIVGKDLTVKYGEEEKTIKDGFLEINYLDGNIIRVENLDLTLQNISSNFSITASGIDLDLLEKRINYNDETKLNLGEITIDSDDNIEIVPTEENTTINEDALNKIEEIENQPIVTPGVDIQGMENGKVDTSIKKADEVIQENATIPDAEFDVQRMDVTANQIISQIQVTDNASTLKGELVWKVVENSTNTIMCMGTQESGPGTVNVDCNKLSPGTNYSLVIRSPYSKNEVNYEKDFVQKTFVTKTTGVTIEKDYVTSTEISYIVEINEHANVTKYNYSLRDQDNNEVTSGTYPPSGETLSKTKTFTFKNIDYEIESNRKYSLVISNIVYDAVEIKNYEVFKILKTLKDAPVYGGTSVQTNKMSSSFSIYLNNVADSDNGILNYRADIYDKRDLTKVVTRREATAAGEIKIEVDDGIIKRQTDYVAKIYVTFFDNEKEYDVYIGQQEMKMTSDMGPQATHEVITALHDSLTTKFTISDPKQTIDLEQPITIILRNSSIAVNSEKPQTVSVDPVDPTRFEFSTTFNDLKKNTSYTYYIKATVDLHDGNGSREMEIAQFGVNTPDTREIAGVFTNDTTSHSDLAFYVTLKLNPSAEGITKDHEIKTMEKLTLRLSSVDYNPTVQTCNANNKCWEKEIYDTKIGPSDSDFLESVYNNELILKREFFDAERRFLTYGEYKIEIIESKDYTRFNNEYKFTTGTTSVNFMVNPSKDSIVDPVKFSERLILNENVHLYNEYTGADPKYTDEDGYPTYYNEALRDDTIVGYAITPSIKYDMQYVTVTKYFVHDLTQASKKYEIPSSAILHVPDSNQVILLFDEFNNDSNKPSGFEWERGKPYGISYEGRINDTAIGFTSNIDSESSFRNLNDQPYKEIPSIAGYVKTRNDDGTFVFKYEYHDVDNAVIPHETFGKTLKYAKQGSADWNYVLCGELLNTYDNCLKETAAGDDKYTNEIGISGFPTGNLTIQMDYETLMQSDPSHGVPAKRNNAKIVDGLQVFAVQDYPTYVEAKFAITRGANNLVYKLSEYSADVLSKRVSNVRLTLKAFDDDDNETGQVVLYKSFEKNGYETGGAANPPTINVDFSEIAALMGAEKITTTMELLYDRNIYGFEPTVDNNGISIEANIDGVFHFENFELDNNIMRVESFDYDTGIITLKTLSEIAKEAAMGGGYRAGDYTLELFKSPKGLYYINDLEQETFVNVKKMYSKNVECNAGALTVCEFSFDSIQPTFILEDKNIKTSIGSVTFTPTVTIDSSVAGFVLRTYYYDTEIVAGEIECKNDIISFNDLTKADLESISYRYQDNALGFGKSYCMKFKYYNTAAGIIEEPEPGMILTEEGYELRDMFYGANYHSYNAEPQRVYKFKTLAQPVFSNQKVAYDTGTLKPGMEGYDAAETSEKQDSNYNRSISASFSVDTLENYSGFKIYLVDESFNYIYDDNGDYYPASINIPLEAVKDFDFKINLDKIANAPAIEAGKRYYLKIIPYQTCNYETDKDTILYGDGGISFTCRESNRRYLSAKYMSVVYNIQDPTVIVQRKKPSNDKNRNFAVRISIDDRFRAVGGYSTANPKDAEYKIEVLTDTGTTLLETIKASQAISVHEIDNIDACENVATTICRVIVRYSVDKNNTGTFIEEYTEKEILIDRDIDLGVVNVSQVSGNSITYTFTNTYNVNLIKSLNVTIVRSNGTGTVQSKNGVDVIWTPDGEDDAYKQQITGITLSKGVTYNITIEFLDVNGITIAQYKSTGISR